MIPFMLLFASAIKLYADPANAGDLHVPGGRATISLVALLGLGTTVVAAVLAVFPADDDPNKALSVLKVLGLTALMAGSGILVYFIGRHRAQAAQS